MTNFGKTPGTLSLLEGKPSASSSSLLDRASKAPSAPLTSAQSQVDHLVSDFTQHATDGKSLVALMAGGGAYRLGRLGVLSAEAGALKGLPLRGLSIVGGLGAEVAVFESTHRGLQSQNSNLWRWNGPNGLRQGLLNSLITFGSIKGAARVGHGENILVRHFLQDTGMVMGHQLSAYAGVTPRPEGSLAEQFLHAEATNLQMAGAMALGHGLTGGRIQAVERGMDLALRSADSKTDNRDLPRKSRLFPLFAIAGGAPEEARESRSGEEREIPTILFSLGGKGGKSKLPEAVNPFEAKKPENEAWTSRSVQAPLKSDSIPKEVRYAIQLAVIRSSGDNAEHGVLALQVGKTLFVYDQAITSNHAKEVGGEAFTKALISLLGRARFIMADQRGEPVRFFMFHTHPKQFYGPGSFMKSPVYQHESGEAFTHINGQDYNSAEQALATTTDFLREYNFTGPIELVAGAIPARTRTANKNPFIATYSRRIEAERSFSKPGEEKIETPAETASPASLREREITLIARRSSPQALESFLLRFPSKPAMGADRVSSEEILHHIREWAKKQGFHPSSEKEALLFWDEVAKARGYESLESLLMMKTGYLAAAHLPLEMRRHRVPEADNYEPDYETKKEERLKIRSEELLPTLLKQGQPAPEARVLARSMADLEQIHPEWKGFLEAGDFQKTDSSYNSQGFYFSLKPNEARGQALLEKARAGRVDAFPELKIRPDRPEAENLQELRDFLEGYRNAERIYYDGGAEEMHCGASSEAVAHLLLAKGFEAFKVSAHRFTSYKGKQAERLYGETLGRFSASIGISPSKAKALAQALEPNLDPGEAKDIAEYLGLSFEAVEKAEALFTKLPPSEREILREEGGWGHKVTAVKISGKYYLIDINQQQFGPRHDELVFIPEAEVLKNGFVLEGSLQGLEAEQSFSERRLSLGAPMDAKQKVIRKYMILQGTLPTGP